MRARYLVRVIALVLPVVLLASACDESSTSPPPSVDRPDSALPDREQPDATTTVDASAPDAADAATATDAADSAVTFVTKAPFATGLGATGMALADGQIDPHWTIKDNGGAALMAYVQTDALGYVGYWLAPSATSKFISPYADTVDPTGTGTFTYTTTFTLRNGVDAGAVQLALRYASDNSVSAIRLNGQSLGGVTAGSYGAFETLTATGPFVEGTNTISFVVANGGGPTGFRAELDLTAN